MASKSAKKCPTLNIKTLVFLMIMLGLIIAFATYAILLLINSTREAPAEETMENDVQVDIIPEEEPVKPVPIDFQPVIDAFASSVGGSKGIIVYDLDLDVIAGAYNADEKFATASIYKLFVVYEGYRRIQNGSFNRDDLAGYTGKTILTCLDLAIRESNSPCAETIWGMIGREELNEIAQIDFDIPSVVVSSLKATPVEIMQMMKLFYEHTEIIDEDLVSTMEDSFLNQPITTYNWRQGLPTGFSDRVLVYNKVGWDWNGSYWNIYDDAAILDFVNEDRHFIAVVMTSGVDHKRIRQFGTDLETAFYDQYVLKN